MDLNCLDKIIAKRWVLLLRYYLPFIKNPAPLHFFLRKFINHLKKSTSDRSFPLTKLPELLFILTQHSNNNPDLINFSKKIIATIKPEQYELINGQLLEQILLKFTPENATVILNELFSRIPARVYSDIILAIRCNKDKRLIIIKWFACLAHHVNFEDRLLLVLTIPDQLIYSEPHLIRSLAITELQSCFLNNTFANNNQLTTAVHEKLLGFIFKWKRTFNFSNEFLYRFVTPLLASNNQTLLAYIKALNIEARFVFFENLLLQSNNLIPIITFLQHCPEEQWSPFIDKLLVYMFSSFKPENSKIIIFTKESSNDICLRILNYLADYQENYPFNRLQFLAITSLAKKPINMHQLVEIMNKNSPLCEAEKTISIELQKYIAKNRIKALNFFIKEHIYPTDPTANGRHTLRKRFHLNCVEPLTELRNIIKKLPDNIQRRHKNTFKIILALLEQLYQLLEQSFVIQAKRNSLFAKPPRIRFKSKIEAQRLIAFLEIAQQCKKELFGESTKSMEDPSRVTLSV